MMSRAWVMHRSLPFCHFNIRNRLDRTRTVGWIGLGRWCCNRSVAQLMEAPDSRSFVPSNHVLLVVNQQLDQLIRVTSGIGWPFFFFNERKKKNNPLLDLKKRPQPVSLRFIRWSRWDGRRAPLLHVHRGFARFARFDGPTIPHAAVALSAVQRKSCYGPTKSWLAIKPAYLVSPTIFLNFQKKKTWFLFFKFKIYIFLKKKLGREMVNITRIHSWNMAAARKRDRWSLQFTFGKHMLCLKILLKEPKLTWCGEQEGCYDKIAKFIDKR